MHLISRRWRPLKGRCTKKKRAGRLNASKKKSKGANDKILKVEPSDFCSETLNEITDNNSITITKMNRQQETNEEYPEETLDIKDNVKQEEDVIIDECKVEIPEYSDLDNSNFDQSPEKLCFDEPINFEAAYGSETAPAEETNDSEQLCALINFICTKCRKTSKDPEYFRKKTDVQCADCQAVMKLQCPNCKLMFRNFDSAVRHAKQNCPVDPAMESFVKTFDCCECIFSTKSFKKLCNHIKTNHKNSKTCSICHGVFTTHYSMLSHIKSCEREPKNACKYCDYRTPSRKSLLGHMQRKHPDPDSCHADGFKCSKCNKKYKTYQPFQSHSKTCTGSN